MQSRTLTNYSDLLIRRGRVEELEEAIAYNIKALVVCGDEINREGRPVIYANLSWASLKLGKMHEAKQYGNEGLSILLQGGFSKHWLQQGYLSMAEVHFGLDELEEALDLCQKGLDIVIEMKNILGQGVARRLMGGFHHRLGQWERAEEMLRGSLRNLENTVSPPDEIALALLYSANLYHDMKKASFRNIPQSTICELVQRAEVIFERLGIYYDKALANRLKEA